MRRSILTVVGLMALALAVPSAALAHHGRGHHHHKSQARHARFIHVGASGVNVSGSSAPAPATTPAAPTTPPAPENAATVKSYTGGVLTLTLNDGSTVSGKVTEDTQIGCVKATPATTPSGTPGTGDQSQGDDNGQGDDQSRGDMSQEGGQDAGNWQHGGQGDGGGDNQEEVQGSPEPPCDSSALLAGALVRSAELRIGASGNEFENVLLVR